MAVLQIFLPISSAVPESEPKGEESLLPLTGACLSFFAMDILDAVVRPDDSP